MKFTFAFTAAQLAGWACAAPASDPESFEKRSDGFTVKQVQNSDFHTIDAPTALISAFAKYGKPPPPSVQKAMANNAALRAKFQNRLSSEFNHDLSGEMM